MVTIVGVPHVPLCPCLWMEALQLLMCLFNLHQHMGLQHRHHQHQSHPLQLSLQLQVKAVVSVHFATNCIVMMAKTGFNVAVEHGFMKNALKISFMMVTARRSSVLSA